jgi:hypothetical protein
MAILRERRYVENAQLWADDIIEKCRLKVEQRLSLSASAFEIELRLIGIDATLGDLETATHSPHEIGVLGIVTADTEALSAEIGKILNPYLLHHPLTEDEPMPTFAFPFSPAEIQRGPLFEFCLNHTLSLDDPMDAFRLEIRNIGHG